MLKNLVIVESPAKAKTIGKFLGPDFKVMSSYGHIRDLQKKNFTVGADKGFEPVYEIPDDKKALVAELKKNAKEAQTVWLASDEDREGEAIAWHLYEVLGLKPDNTRRIVFHEITKEAILAAIEHPRDIDLNLVDAQQARRLLDRIVGFELSPVLWRKIRPSLSAGRVQSVAVRLIVERENEIKNFKQEESYRVVAEFRTAGDAPVRSELSHRFATEAEAADFLRACAGTDFTVGSVNVRPVKKAPAPPFTTSTLQQEAARKLGFTVSQTMMIAQRLYEAGHITYMRTDSLNLSSLAIGAMRKEIAATLGEKYFKERHYHTSSKGAQEAHEAIRPTYASNHTIDGTPQEKRLYGLIWKRAIASQMADAEIEKTTVDILPASRPEHFTASGEVIKFDGFLKVYMEGSDKEEGSDQLEGLLPAMAEGEKLSLADLTAMQRFTQTPPRYTEASLVKKLEELGIGRPSTYAPTISTIQQREYVEKGEKEGVAREFTVLSLGKDGSVASRVKTETVGSEKGKLIPTDIGEIVNTYLTEYFPNILDYNFTAQIEEKFDKIADGNLPWHKEIADFYEGFHPGVESALNTRLEHKVGERVLGSDPATGKPVTVKIGRFGPMVQLGDSEGEEKPEFASLLKGQSVNTITLEEALKLFAFPRHIGEFEGKEVTVAIGRFGPYVKHDGKFVSIPKDMSPSLITLDEASQLIVEKRQAEANRLVKTFDEEPEIQILNGRYGIYIAKGKTNYKIPKTVENPAELTLEECRAIIEEQDAKPKRTTATRRRK
ncbi:MAG: type I DNA topoisomerase [[Clostridium] fimetarium]|nr:type I DNA topoisomerase [Alistipes timonensis]MCM1406035.1 type I DNA topoisomerase [[Clostridium] fimetarium]